jgi:hypothetical protein
MKNTPEYIDSENNQSNFSAKTKPSRVQNLRLGRNKSIILLVCMLPIIVGCSDKIELDESLDINRIDEVREKGTEIMPFDLDKTLHTFEKSSDGGVQIVSLRDNNNADQLNPIREHLKKIAYDFENGIFDDPVSIHGGDMPGLATLQANASKFSIKYFELENGAKLEYRSTDKDIISAIHLWFDAQVSDHGPDATNNNSDIFPGFSEDHICQMHPETCVK